MSGCARPCRYRGHDAGEWCNGCDYMGMTHKSRLVQVYSRLGVKTLTREARRMLEPRNCPFFEPGERGRVVSLQMPTPHRREREARSFRFDTGEARRLYEQGLNDLEIARRLGRCHDTIRCWRRAEGLPNRWRERKRKPDPERVRRLRDEGLSDREIAERLDSTTKRVRTCRVENGIPPIERKRVDREALRRAWEEGLNDEEIRLRVGCARRTVTEWRLANGLPPGRARRKR